MIMMIQYYLRPRKEDSEDKEEDNLVERYHINNFFSHCNCTFTNFCVLLLTLCIHYFILLKFKYNYNSNLNIYTPHSTIL